MQKITPHLWFDKEAQEALTAVPEAELARVTQAFLKMKTFDIPTLEKAYEGRA